MAALQWHDGLASAREDERSLPFFVDFFAQG